MKKTYLTTLFLFGVASLSNGAAPSNFETFLQEWNTKTDSVEQRKGTLIQNATPEYQDKSTPDVPAEAKVFDETSKAHALYEVLAGFKHKGVHRFDPQTVKQHVLELCETLSKDPSGINACTEQVAKNSETLCKAAPIIARDTCTDMLQQAFPPAAQGSQPEKHSRFSDKFKFWKKFKNSDAKAGA